MVVEPLQRENITREKAVMGDMVKGREKVLLIVVEGHYLIKNARECPERFVNARGSQERMPERNHVSYKRKNHCKNKSMTAKSGF